VRRISPAWILLAALFPTGCDHALPSPVADSGFEFGLEMPGTPLLSPTDPPEVLLDKAIAAFGGPQCLERWKCGHLKFLTRSETIPVLNEKPTTAEEFFQLPGHLKRVVHVGQGDREQTIVFLVNNEQGMEYRPDGTSRPLSPDSIFSVLRTEHSFADFCNLARLRNPLIRLSNHGEQNVNGRAAVVLRAETDFTLPTDFLFDRATGLLLQSIRRMPQSGGEKLIETTLGDYRLVGAGRVPHRIVGRCDGKVLLDFTITDLEFLDHLDDRVFAPPSAEDKVTR
jgi:hypothetical protein